jgi:hypothetical protein
MALSCEQAPCQTYLGRDSGDFARWGFHGYRSWIDTESPAVTGSTSPRMILKNDRAGRSRADRLGFGLPDGILYRAADA